MNRQTFEQVQKLLGERGYRRITNCKATDNDDFEYYKAFYEPDSDPDEENQLKYQIFFEFWDFTKYSHFRPDITDENGFGISVTVLPESCQNFVGRRDLKLGVGWTTDINRVEKVAEKFYEFLKKYVD